MEIMKKIMISPMNLTGGMSGCFSTASSPMTIPVSFSVTVEFLKFFRLFLSVVYSLQLILEKTRNHRVIKWKETVVSSHQKLTVTKHIRTFQRK